MKRRRKRRRIGPIIPFYKRAKKRWVVRYKEGGKTREKFFQLQSKAVEFASDRFDDQLDGIDSQNMTFGDVATRFLSSKSGASASTRADYRTTLGHAGALSDIPLRTIKPLDVQAVIESRKTSSSRKRLRGMLSMVFLQAVRWELIRRNPVDGTQKQQHRPEKAEIFEGSEVSEILEAGKELRLVGMFDLGFTLGPRPEELMGFQWGDWDEKKRQLRVVRKVAEVNGSLDIGPPKTPAALRAMVLPEHITARLTERRKAAQEEGRADSTDWIFPNVRGGPMRRSNLRQKVWKKLLEDAGVRYRKPYCMRHTAASTMLNGTAGVRGISLAVVSKTLGHENPQITLERYSHTLKTELSQVAAFWDSTKQG